VRAAARDAVAGWRRAIRRPGPEAVNVEETKEASPPPPLPEAPPLYTPPGSPAAPRRRPPPPPLPPLHAGDDVVYAPGAAVLYRSGSGGDLVDATVLKVHLDDPPEAYYTISVDGVGEKQTDGARLRPKPPEEVMSL
jgi:hypothetical protein